MLFKKPSIILLLLLITIPFGFAQNYPSMGGPDQNWQLGQGIFALDEVTPTSYPKGLTDTKHAPLAFDADNNGQLEFYIIDSDDIKIYEGITLEFKTSVDYGDEERTSSPIMHDIDGDSLTEFVIVLEQSNLIQAYHYNGSSLNLKANFSYATAGDVVAGTNAGETMIACKAANDCLLQYNERFNSCASLANCAQTSAVIFNSTDFVAASKVTLENTGGVNSNDHGLFCRSGAPLIAVSDIDIDGVDEYVFTVGEIAQDTAVQSNNALHIFSVESDGSTLTVDQLASQTMADVFEPGTGTDCDDGETETLQFHYGDYYTSPLIGDFKDDFGQEIVIARQTNFEEYRIELYEFDGSLSIFDIFPQTEDSNGNIISNPFLANAFPESDETRDFCVVGYNRELNPLAEAKGEFKQLITCGSKDKSGFETAEFEYDFDENIFNVTFNYDLSNTLAHAVQHSNAITSGDNLHEVLTPYGIFTLDQSTCSPVVLFGKDSCDSTPIYESTFGNAAVIAVDSEAVGNEDLLFMSDVALFYVDDGITNAPPDNVLLSSNPCITDGAIKINTTLQLTITAEDGNSDFFLDDDNLNITVTIYDGQPYAQEQNIGVVTSGAPASFSFTANVTGTNEVIRIVVDDNINDPFVSVANTFTVGANGLEFGDSSCDIVLLADVEEVVLVNVTAFDGTSTQDNVVTNSARSVGSLFGLGAGVMYLIIMLIIMGGIVWQGASTGQAVFGLYGALIIGTGMLVLGSLLNLIPIAVIIITVVIAIAIVAIAVSRATFAN